MKDDDHLLKTLEQLGEEKVRFKLASGEYGSVGYKRQIIVDWLKMKAYARNDFLISESLRVANSAKNAAWIAAIMAIIAAIIAILSIPSVHAWLSGLISSLFSR